MSITRRALNLACGIALVQLLAVSIPGGAADKDYEAYYLFTGEFPHNEGTIYSHNFQGLTHDDNNWFLSTNSDGNSHPTLFKVPVQYDLRHVSADLPDQYPGVIRRSLHDDLPSHLVNYDKYHHFGDISYYEFNNTGFVLVPTESSVTLDAVFLFRASDLQYIGRLLVPSEPARPSWWNCNDTSGPPGRALGWVAVDSAGFLYASGDCVNTIHKYSVNWENVPGAWTGSEYIVTLVPAADITVLDESGSPLQLGHTQGGVFSESGRLFYILVGQIHDHEVNEGINVFDTTTWKRIRRSDNQSKPDDLFDYNFDPGSPYYEEPEGITIWDLDDGRAPNIRGQLHVGKADWEINGYDIYMDHYTNVIRVVPPNTVNWANSLAWDGARIELPAGDYPETITFSKRIQISSKGGTARIGIGVGQ